MHCAVISMLLNSKSGPIAINARMPVPVVVLKYIQYRYRYSLEPSRVNIFFRIFYKQQFATYRYTGTVDLVSRIFIAPKNFAGKLALLT
jgi:hypothetical protein